jgi:DNA invertase Pin-like site-specific DNA recombinase
MTNFLKTLQEGDVIITESIAILSNIVEEIVKVINCILSHGITLHIVNSNTIVNRVTTLQELFPLLNDLREEQRSKTRQIGRTKGSRSSSKFDVYQSKIISLMKEGMNVSAIARELGVSRSCLKDYIESRNIKDLVEGTWVEVSSPQKSATSY